MNNQMTGLLHTGTLVDGTAQTIAIHDLPLPLTVWVRPFAGDTVTVSYSTDDGANYQVWPNGTAGAVTAYSEDALISGATYIKFQRTAGSGTTSSWGLC